MLLFPSWRPPFRTLERECCGPCSDREDGLPTLYTLASGRKDQSREGLSAEALCFSLYGPKIGQPAPMLCVSPGDNRRELWRDGQIDRGGCELEQSPYSIPPSWRISAA